MMVFFMERLSVSFWEFGLDQLVLSRLVLIKLLYLENHLELLTHSYLVYMM